MSDTAANQALVDQAAAMAQASKCLVPVHGMPYRGPEDHDRGPQAADPDRGLTGEGERQMKLLIVSDMKSSVAVLRTPDGFDLEAARQEYDSIMDPGPNPMCYEGDKPRQAAWVEKSREREQFLTLKYGGENDSRGRTYFGAVTFANWLVREKGAESYPFSAYCMAEFD